MFYRNFKEVSMVSVSREIQAELGVPHSRFKKGLPAKKMMGGDRHNRWGQT